MILPDVNVLVYAHRTDTPDHVAYRQWLENVINNQAPYGMSDLVLSGFLRVVSHRRIFDPPSSSSAAMAFVDEVRNQANCVHVKSGPRHWAVFQGLCHGAGITGNLIPDAYLAAIAIEHGCEWVTTDRDYALFSGLNWRHPLANLKR